MFVSSYQIHNVLNVYSKQLSQDRNVQKLKPGTINQPSDQIKLSTEGKRRATIERVAQEILNKISHYGSEGEIKTQEPDASRENAKSSLESDNKKEAGFVFNVIDRLNQKTKTALSVKDTKFLIDRLEQMAIDTVEVDAGI
ncbi:MAG: hypothetical protein OET18_03085 [Desulfobacterales bacterium]|jgi:hypothetical protein|nr:hypothetical protein [Desulfobacterales bacterium]MDH3876805.1 hypothetical protein [Desulfobacterales bacterium]